MRNCDPRTDHRPLTNQRSNRWNDDNAIDCHWQSTGPYAPGQSREVPVTGPRQFFSVERAATIFAKDISPAHLPGEFSSQTLAVAPRRNPGRSSCYHRNSVSWLVSQRVFGRFDSQFILEQTTQLLFRSIPEPSSLLRLQQSRCPASDQLRTCFADVIHGGDNSWRSNLRTHSLMRMSDEKRNADECLATRGKSDRHR